jgi:hypothetical protein
VSADLGRKKKLDCRVMEAAKTEVPNKLAMAREQGSGPRARHIRLNKGSNVVIVQANFPCGNKFPKIKQRLDQRWQRIWTGNNDKSEPSKKDGHVLTLN